MALKGQQAKQCILSEIVPHEIKPYLSSDDSHEHYSKLQNVVTVSM
jgi:hypothetical protein